MARTRCHRTVVTLLLVAVACVSTPSTEVRAETDACLDSRMNAKQRASVVCVVVMMPGGLASEAAIAKDAAAIVHLMKVTPPVKVFRPTGHVGPFLVYSKQDLDAIQEWLKRALEYGLNGRNLNFIVASVAFRPFIDEVLPATEPLFHEIGIVGLAQPYDRKLFETELARASGMKQRATARDEEPPKIVNAPKIFAWITFGVAYQGGPGDPLYDRVFYREPIFVDTVPEIRDSVNLLPYGSNLELRPTSPMDRHGRLVTKSMFDLLRMIVSMHTSLRTRGVSLDGKSDAGGSAANDSRPLADRQAAAKIEILSMLQGYKRNAGADARAPVPESREARPSSPHQTILAVVKRDYRGLQLADTLLYDDGDDWVRVQRLSWPSGRDVRVFHARDRSTLEIFQAVQKKAESLGLEAGATVVIGGEPGGTRFEAVQRELVRAGYRVVTVDVARLDAKKAFLKIAEVSSREGGKIGVLVRDPSASALRSGTGPSGPGPAGARSDGSGRDRGGLSADLGIQDADVSRRR